MRSGESEPFIAGDQKCRAAMPVTEYANEVAT